MNVFEAVKQSVTTRQAAEHYGIRVNRNGMACCPFHNDKTPSMKLDKRFHCFGCGADGDVIDFVAALYGLGKKEAAAQLASDFGLAYEDWKPPGRARKPKPRQKSPEEQFREAKAHCFRVLADYLHLLRVWKTDYAPHSPEEAFHPRFVEALQKQAHVEYLLDVLLFGDTEEIASLIEEDIAKVGDTLKIAGRAFDGSTFDVEAVVVGTYNRSDLMENSPVVPGSPYFIMTYDTAKKLTGITEQTGILAVKNSDGRFDDVLTAVQEIADKNGKIEVNTIEQTIKNIQHQYRASINALYMASAILFVFGSISLMNMLIVDFQSRKREFGLLEAVGTTQKQLKIMLNREIGIYLGGSLAISLVCGSILSVIACRKLDAANHCITLELPWLFLLALIAVLAVIYLIFTAYAKAELKKAEILPAIREE